MPPRSSRAQKAKKYIDKPTSPKVPRVKVTGGKPVHQNNDNVTHPEVLSSSPLYASSDSMGPVRVHPPLLISF